MPPRLHPLFFGSLIVLVRCVKMNCNLGFKNKGAGWKFGVMSSIKGGREEYRRSLLAADLRPHSLISFISNK